MVRGRDWKWGDQDGGSGHVGTLSEVTAWSEWPRSGAKVIWNLLRSNKYRTGYQGLVCSSVKIQSCTCISMDNYGIWCHWTFRSVI